MDCSQVYEKEKCNEYFVLKHKESGPNSPNSLLQRASVIPYKTKAAQLGGETFTFF